MKKSLILSFCLFFGLGSFVLSQNSDSLMDKSFAYLARKMDSFQYDRKNPMAWVYTQAYINKAKYENNLSRLYTGYRDASFYSWEKENKLAYNDSLIWVAEKIEDNIDKLGMAYDLRGGVYYIFRDYKNTLNFYLKASEILEKSENKNLKFNNLYGIGVIKFYLGYYEDARLIFEETEAYFKTSDDPSYYELMYLRSLFRLSELYQALGNFEQSSYYNLLGLQKAIEYGEKNQENYFNLLIGINDYHRGEYAQAITNMKKVFPSAQDMRYFELEQRAHYYIAQSYLALKQNEKALVHFKKFDSITAINGFLEPRLRSGYEWLINHYQSEGDKEKELYYINRLLDTDQINSIYTKDLAYTINKEYDTRRLLETKKKLESSFSRWKVWGYSLLGLLMIGSAFLLFRNLRLKKEKEELQKKFEEAANRPAMEKLKEPEEKVKKSTQEIPEETVQDILARLDKFEEKKGFLDRNLTLVRLANQFKTNTSYLSKIVNSSRRMSFNNYLKKLRTDYMIELLKTESQCRNYTLEVLAEICGFTSGRQLSDTFKEETGLKPSEFLERLGKE